MSIFNFSIILKNEEWFQGVLNPATLRSLAYDPELYSNSFFLSLLFSLHKAYRTMPWVKSLSGEPYYLTITLE